MKTIGERIRDFRGKTSREAFAAHYNIHPNSLRRYEMNERMPDPSFLRQLEGEEGWVKIGTISGESGDSPNPLERENALLREMLVLQKENGDLRIKMAQLETRNTELERQLAECLKKDKPAAMGGGMSKAG